MTDSSKERRSTYHSPVPIPSPLLVPDEDSWVFPAAAEAKLDGSGEGMMRFQEAKRVNLISDLESIKTMAGGG